LKVNSLLIILGALSQTLKKKRRNEILSTGRGIESMLIIGNKDQTSQEEGEYITPEIIAKATGATETLVPR